MEHPNRKSTRIPGYDYSTCNYYFITICTSEKKCIFYDGDSINEFGKIAEACLDEIQNHFPSITVDKSVVMPNHVHAILIVGKHEGVEHTESIVDAVGQYKSSVSRKIHLNDKNIEVWQRSFHDHVIRNQESYEKIWNYIDGNPLKWKEDCFYQPND